MDASGKEGLETNEKFGPVVDDVGCTKGAANMPVDGAVVSEDGFEPKRGILGWDGVEKEMVAGVEAADVVVVVVVVVVGAAAAVVVVVVVAGCCGLPKLKLKVAGVVVAGVVPVFAVNENAGAGVGAAAEEAGGKAAGTEPKRLAPGWVAVPNAMEPLPGNENPPNVGGLFASGFFSGFIGANFLF